MSARKIYYLYASCKFYLVYGYIIGNIFELRLLLYLIILLVVVTSPPLDEYGYFWCINGRAKD